MVRASVLDREAWLHRPACRKFNLNNKSFILRFVGRLRGGRGNLPLSERVLAEKKKRKRVESTESLETGYGNVDEENVHDELKRRLRKFLPGVSSRSSVVGAVSATSPS